MSTTVDIPPLRGPALAIVAFALALGTFMQVLDTTVANVSLPTIAGDLGASTSQGTWIVTSFAVANGVTVPLTGWLMTRFGVVRTFIGSIILFTIASFLCGIAWSLPSLVLFRVLQGAVSGPLIPGSQALLISIFPPERRATALAVWSMTTLIGPVSGPVLGGYISDNFHWGWIFLINVPIGLFSAAVCAIGMRKRETPTRKLRVDSIGIALLIVWVGSLQVMLDQGKDADWFHSTLIIVLALISGIVFLVWLIWELTEEHPTVDMRLFRKRNFTSATIAFCLGYAAFFGSVLLMPLYLQTQVGYTATWSGLNAAPSGIVALIMTPIVVRFNTRFDARIWATFSLVAFAISYFMRAHFTTGSSFWDYTLPMLWQGAGMSCFFLSMLVIQLDDIDPEDIPLATGISNFVRITAGGFSASIITTMWDRREALHQTRLADQVTLFSPRYQESLHSLQQLGLNAQEAAAVMTRLMVQQAYQLAANEIFWVTGWIALAIIGSVWLARKPKKVGN